jgi:hypothetical protein
MADSGDTVVILTRATVLHITIATRYPLTRNVSATRSGQLETVI